MVEDARKDVRAREGCRALRGDRAAFYIRRKRDGSVSNEGRPPNSCANLGVVVVQG